ncbi:MAG: M28 family peptidase [Candidatus Hadarchaeales archaeon]
MSGFEVKNVFEHVDMLAYEIGPRKAGSRGDRRTVEYLSSKLREYGLKVHVQEFGFVGRTRRLAFMLSLGLLFLSLTFFLPPLRSLLLWSLFLLLSEFSGRILPGQKTCNLLAEMKGEGERKVLLAHRDSASCVSRPRLLEVSSLFLPLSLLLPSFLLLLRLLFPPLWPWGGFLSLFLFALFPSLRLLSLSSSVSPGANDNASGVALLLEVARVCSQLNPVPPLLLAFTGAEEEGLWGSKALASGGVLRREDRILNVDTVGVGRVHLVVGSGLLRRRETPRGLNEEVRRCLKEEGLRPGEWWTVFSAHDHLPLLRKGFSATTLTADTGLRRDSSLFRFFRIPKAGRRGWRYLHTEEDLPPRLELSTLERVGKALLRFAGAGEGPAG